MKESFLFSWYGLPYIEDPYNITKTLISLWLALLCFLGLAFLIVAEMATAHQLYTTPEATYLYYAKQSSLKPTV